MDWARKVESKIFYLGDKEIYWQPVLKFIRGSDLVIVEQASKLLINYILILQNSFRIRNLAFWGHGKNFQQQTSNRFGEWIKKLVSTHVHWWFAYNQISADVVRSMGFPKEHITLVQNAIDTRKLTQRLSNISQSEILALRRELNIQSRNVAIYTGGIYFEKRIPFLLKAIEYVRAQIKDFEMIFIGGGTESYLVEEAAKQAPWIHYVGPVFGSEKVPYYAISKVFLMPGLVGLGILDTFALETPLVTTNVPIHSPEIEYLIDGENGIMVESKNDPKLYARAVVDLFLDNDLRNKLIEGCKFARQKYTIEAMVDRFCEGVILALNH